MKKVILLLLVVFFSNNFNSNELLAQSKSETEGKVTGYVVDMNGAVIVLPIAKLTFISKDFQKTISVNSDGFYEVKLPFGVYSVTLKLQGFHTLKRSVFNVQNRDTYNLNLVASPIYKVRGTSVSETESVDILSDVPKYEILFNDENLTNGIKPVIQYESKCEVNNEIEYKNVIITYNFLTIYADKLLFNDNGMIYTANGSRLLVQNGIECSSIKSFSVKLFQGKIVFDFSCK